MSLVKRKNKIFEQIQSRLSEYIRITDAEEEVCELYSVYYSREEGGSSRSKQNRVDSRKTELDLEIKGGKRTLSLTINQNPNINGELGQTGGVLWNSSVIMSEFFAQHSEWAGDGSLDVGETNIVELGTGCGLVGLVLHQLGARRVALTDQQRMMKVINRNIAAAASARQPNRASGSSRRQKPGDFGGSSRGECEIYATEYLWGRPPEDLRITSEPIDMVVVSDCVYHESIAPLLVHTLADLCRSKSNKADDGSTVAVVVGQELRSDLVHQAFVEALLRTFVVYRVPVSADVDGFYALYVAWLKDEEEQ
ncbi:hypothetical protein GGI11_000015 [Coemansia sp. RSA 2049]|nr:hypothetical protein GGI11_000015 [Coemansia sp. RSA 2049]KAJ2654221.1 hypothetical protein GGH99_007373 [Coemansia sp. RSA 1285]